MVGRLVKQQKVRPRQQELAKAQLRLLAAAQIPTGLVEILFWEAEAHQRRAGAAAVGKPSHALESVVQILLPVDQCVELPLSRLQQVCRLRQLPLNLHHVRKNGQHFVIDTACGVRAGVLLQIAYTRLLRHKGLSGSRLQLPGNQPKQRRLARAVYADEAHPVMLTDLKGNTVKQDLVAKADV